jgi:hypothetical protein
MPLEEYEWAVNEMMKDNAYLYNLYDQRLVFFGCRSREKNIDY